MYSVYCMQSRADSYGYHRKNEQGSMQHQGKWLSRFPELFFSVAGLLPNNVWMYLSCYFVVHSFPDLPYSLTPGFTSVRCFGVSKLSTWMYTIRSVFSCNAHLYFSQTPTEGQTVDCISYTFIQPLAETMQWDKIRRMTNSNRVFNTTHIIQL